MSNLSASVKEFKKAVIPNPRVTEDIIKLGGDDLLLCFQCGSCTAICPISEELNTNFRKTIKYAQLGLEEKILGDTTPWLCHACGECSDSCPRNANPSNILAAIRRYLVRRYAWGVVAPLFSSTFRYFASLMTLSLLFLVGLLFVHGPLNFNSIDLFSFVPVSVIHNVGVYMAVVVLFFFFSNLYVMYIRVRGKVEEKGRLRGTGFTSMASIFLREILLQSLFSKCERKTKRYFHLLLFWGFISAFLASIAALLVDLKILSAPAIDLLFRTIAKILGILGGLMLTVGSSYFIYKRVKRDERSFERSHIDDWTLLVLLFLAATTGLSLVILEYSFNYLGFTSELVALSAYTLFTIHLLSSFNLLLLAPLTKLSHAGYRTLALLLSGGVSERYYDVRPIA